MPLGGREYRPKVTEYKQYSGLLMRRNTRNSLVAQVNQNMCWPPLIEMLAPVTNAASSEQR